jgi:hypothetical protein
MTFKNDQGAIKETYVHPRVILRFVTPSDAIYIQDDFLYTKVTGIDRRNESHRVFNLEVDGPEHSYCGPSLALKNCAFPSDSDGFFKRTLIASCEKEIGILLYGRKDRQYVLSLDPARSKDRASIIIEELDYDGLEQAHNAVVYCWSTRESEITDEVIPGQEEKFDDNISRKKRYYNVLILSK